MPPQPDNPRGFWENRAISVLNERLLTALGGAWDCPPPLVSGWERSPAVEPWLAECRVRLEELSSTGDGVFVVKDPRLSFTLPLWQRVTPAAHVVLPLRDPVAVAQSLRARNGIPLERGIGLWLAYNQSLLDTRGNDIAVVDYEALVAQPRDTAESLCATLNLAPATPDALKEVEEFLEPSMDHNDPYADELSPTPVVQQAGEMFKTLRSRAVRPSGRTASRQVAATSATLTVPAPGPRRTVILHHHLFKNAGTSLDALLQEQFPGRWETREFPGNQVANRSETAEWIRSCPDAVCFSSHTAVLGVSVSGVDIIPVVFVRHPIDRIASAYAFEHQQDAHGFGATLARNTTLRGYIETRLSLPRDRQCRNFHTHRFADAVDSTGSEFERALKAIETLPFVGVVEDFDHSIARLQELLRGRGFGAVTFGSVQRNMSSGRSRTLDERLERIADDIGAELYATLERVNEDDLAFYEAVTARWGSAS